MQPRLREYDAVRYGAGPERREEREDRAEAGRLNAGANGAEIDAEKAQTVAETDREPAAVWAREACPGFSARRKSFRGVPVA